MTASGPGFISLQVRDIEASAGLLREVPRTHPPAPARPTPSSSARRPPPSPCATPMPGVDLNSGAQLGLGIGVWMHAPDAQQIHDTLVADGFTIASRPRRRPVRPHLHLRRPRRLRRSPCTTKPDPSACGCRSLMVERALIRHTLLRRRRVRPITARSVRWSTAHPTPDLRPRPAPRRRGSPPRSRFAPNSSRPGCSTAPSASEPRSTGSKPSASMRCRDHVDVALVVAASAIALRPGRPPGRAPSSRSW